MTRSTTARPFAELLALTRTIAREVAAKHADSVDREARFPSETLAALKDAKLLSTLVPSALGGDGASLSELAQLCSVLAEGCSSSAMILAMHQIQVACLVRHGQDTPFFQNYLRLMVSNQPLIGSVTSEVGTFGDTRSSICGVEVAGDRFTLMKKATTVSYGAYCDALLLTCRRNPETSASDQVLVLATKDDYQLKQTTAWDTLGMRGTNSPGFEVHCQGSAEQILPGAYADSSAMSMVPYSHVLWSALWQGIAADAVGRAATMVRAEARKTPGTTPTSAIRLAQVHSDLQAMKHHWQATANEFDQLEATDAGRTELLSLGWALKFNNLKTSCSDMAPRIVHQALQITGIMGYKNDSPYSVGRHYRDVLSASLMVSNDRIAAKSASMLLVFKDT
jgi:acyl-CoA dehydrogenase